MPGTSGDDFDPNLEDFDDDDFRDTGGLQDDEGGGDDADQTRNGPGDEDRSQPAEEGVADGREVDEEVRQPSRDERRSAVLARERAELRAERDALVRELAELRQGSDRQREQEEQRRLAEMEPWERAEYTARQAERTALTAVQRLEARIADSSDKAEFAAECAANPTLAKVRDKVEETLAQSRANGVTIPRKTVAAFLLGQQMLEKAPKARAAAERRGAANLSRERARPVTTGSDAAPGRAPRDDRSARLQRLENASI